MTTVCRQPLTSLVGNNIFFRLCFLYICRFMRETCGVYEILKHYYKVEFLFTRRKKKKERKWGGLQREREREIGEGRKNGG